MLYLNHLQEWIEGSSVGQAIVHQPEENPVGRKARVFADSFSPEAEGVIEQVRGYGSLRVVEIRIFPKQPGPKIRVAHEGQWEVIKEVAS